MTIRIATGLRQSYNNAVEVSPEEALGMIKTRTDCYEVLGEENRVFLDVDGKKVGTDRWDECYAKTLDEFRRFIHPYALGDSSCREKGIVSFRVVFPTIKMTKRENQAFAKNICETMNLPDGVSVDTGVYGSNQKIRMENSSKDGENRPMRLIQGTSADFLISHCEKAEHTPYEVEEVRETAVVEVVEQEKLVSICRLIKIERWTDYQTCMRLIFALKSAGAKDEFIHQQCRQAENYGRKWVDNLIRTWSPTKSPTFASLRYYAKQDSPEEFRCLLRANNELSVEHFVDELLELDTTGCPEEDLNWCEQGRWLKDLPDDDTLAVKSIMGTGKTRAVVNTCKNPAIKRILCISARKTFSDFLLGEIKLTDYRDLKSRTKQGLITNDRALVSIQSIYRRGGEEPEDLLILDEVETLLACMSPNKTHVHNNVNNYVENYKTFERLVRTAKRVVCLDAFLTNRTINMLRALRPSVRILVNPSIPYKRKGVVFSDKGAFISTAHKLVAQKKKLYMFWGSKEMGAGFHEVLTCPNQLYTANTDSKIRARDLGDVNTHWSTLQVVGGTSAISVGVSYSGDPTFDMVCAYISSFAGGSGRDTAQSIHRTRTLNDERMMFCILDIADKKGDFACELGFATQKALYSRVNQNHKAFLTSIGEEPAQYDELPEWLRDVIVWNRNERIVNRRHIRQVCFAYFKQCGIEIELNSSVQDYVKPELRCPPPDEVKTICSIRAELYQKNREVLSTEQKYELEKHYLLKKVNTLTQDIWVQWLKCPQVIRNAWSVFNLKPEQMVEGGDRVIDLVSKDAEKLGVVLKLGIDFTKPFNRPIADLPVPEVEYFGVRKRAKKETKEQTYRDLCRAMKDWGDIRIRVVGEKVGPRGKRKMNYHLDYDPKQNTTLSAVRRPLTAGEVFVPE